MTRPTPLRGAMETTVRLRRGTSARRITFTLTLRSERFDAREVARAFGTFANAVDAGLLGGDPTPWITHAVQEQHAGPVSTAIWEASFPRLPPEAFAVLARMTAASVRGARRLEIREHAPEPALVVKGFEDEAEPTLPMVPWELTFTTAEVPALTLALRDPLTPEHTRRIIEIVETWSSLLGLGGFRAPDRAFPSTAEPWRIDQTGERELTARFVCLSAEHEAFEALFLALLRLDETAPIASLRIASLAPAPESRCIRRRIRGASPSRPRYRGDPATVQQGSH